MPNTASKSKPATKAKSQSKSKPKTKLKSKVRIRRATKDDIPTLMKLNVAAYPVLADENVVWGAAHLASHQRMFPQGQFIAEVKGQIVGAASTLIVNMGSNSLRHHTWSGVTDSGYFTNHDANGDTLYGADIYVHPDARGLGVGAALYEARRQLCKKLNKRRILAGGRLIGYSEYGDQMSAHEYARHVVDGEIRDLVLSFQLREGFHLRDVMPNYLRDPQSRNHASLIEWLNPDYRSPHKGARKVRVACVQYQMRKINSFADFARQVSYFTDIAADNDADFVLFPELFSVQLLSTTHTKSPQEGMKKLAELAPKLEALFTKLAVKYGLTIIGGSHPTRVGKDLQNICTVYLPDGTTAQQPKLHITPNERRWWGITGGSDLRVIQAPAARIGVLVCYDSEFPEAARCLADAGAEIIFVPFCTDNRQGYLRVRLCCAARAIENQVYVALAGNVGNLPDVENMDVQYGQAAVLTPSDFAFARDGIAAEADANEETVLICDLDLDELAEAQAAGTVTPRQDRREDLFKVTTTALRLPAHDSDKVGPLGEQRDVSTRAPESE